ncbi:TonB-dependent receptor [Sphingorhabdus sp.]|jgi:iron complex outermembrane receptor protein|uniref:TonB-dependent receptor n=3 Tax=Sphingorhabdus sp. TaxID=1902408 RepID=UPI003BAE54EF|nr:TonB-dependent receptor [Sphingomonadales bacterium]MBL0020841.1 TonB-dependent receptor [Sphingomonadales bacterium]
MNAIFRNSSATLAISLALIAMPAFAQEQAGTETTDDDFHRTGEIVVTAPYFERLDLLAGTSALSGEDLAQQARGQIGETLLSLPGVSATSFSPGASRPVLRGFQGSRVAVLTDGIGNIDASNTSADHAVTIDPLTTERIEVLRGPAVLLFGGQAVGGAVNAIDKRIPRKVPDEAVHIDAQFDYSTAAKEYAGGASIDVPMGDRFVFHLDGSHRKSKDLRIGGYLLAPALRQEALDVAAEEQALGNLDEAVNARDWANFRGRLPNSAVKTTSLGAGAAFIDDGGNLGISFNLYDTQYGIAERPDFVEPVGGEVSIDLRQYRFDLRGEVELGEGLFDKIRIRAGYADYVHKELEGPDVGTTFFSKAIETRLELTQNNRGGWRGASGLQYQTRDFEAVGDEAFLPPTRSNQIGLFTLQEFSLGNLDAEVSVRFDHARLEAQSLATVRNFDNFSAAFGLGYTIGDIKIGTNISRTGRAPSVEELYSDGPHVATQSYEVGDPLLRSERSWNGEIYARYDSTRFDATATLYANRFSNFIYENATGAIVDDLPEFEYLQRKARVWGIEAEASANIGSFGGFDVLLDGVADFTRATIKGEGPAPRIPPLRLLGGLELQSDNFELRGEVEWADSQKRIADFETTTGGFTMVSASATWRPFGRDKNISLTASADNIFDVEARRAASFTKDFVALAGRDFRLTARLSF